MEERKVYPEFLRENLKTKVHLYEHLIGEMLEKESSIVKELKESVDNGEMTSDAYVTRITTLHESLQHYINGLSAKRGEILKFLETSYFEA